jgi:organic hydroperoxide reductase OsmC/OhrA
MPAALAWRRRFSSAAQARSRPCAGSPADNLPTGTFLLHGQIAAVHLVLRARVPGLEDAKFQELAAGAKANCPVSKVLNAAITLDAKLE